MNIFRTRDISVDCFVNKCSNKNNGEDLNCEHTECKLCISRYNCNNSLVKYLLDRQYVEY